MECESPIDRLWREYGGLFAQFDDLSLARWMSQTLGQLRRHCWRLSHPLVGTYRLAAQAAYNRQIWLKRLVTIPPDYVEAECCRAPLLPLVTRDILDSGLVCQHCAGTAIPFSEITPDLQDALRVWSRKYHPVHAVAHWDEKARKACSDYDQAFEDAAKNAERILQEMGRSLAPQFLDTYPVIVWEDQDECLEVRPEDLDLTD